ncbi:MAG: SAF domain-containing protein [Holosporaceae bacterium]|jgi:Flp pilus assembly protein CpaB|nr:SAF domain-containing protein [Holosporaceae bacterium]
MNSKKLLPALMALVAAFIVTAILAFFISGKSGPSASSPSSSAASLPKKNSVSDISMPDIPLMVKENKKEKECRVLIVSKDIKSGSKITLESLAWKTWPPQAVQPYFIAKNDKDVPLNNKDDYNNALKMWAASDIPAGVPLIMRMLINEDPIKKEREAAEKKKKEEEEKKRKAEEAKKKSASLRTGMRALTVPLDQKSTIPETMLEVGNRVDVLVSVQNNSRTRVFKYAAIRILAVDGMTSKTKVEDKKSEKNTFERGGLLTGLSNVSSLLSVKNITIEIKEDLVKEFLQRLGNNGIVLSLRNQEDIADTEEGLVTEESESERELDSVLRSMAKMNQENSAEILKKNKEKEKDFSVLIDKINSAGVKHSKEIMIKEQQNKREKKQAESTLIESLNFSDQNSSKNALLEVKRQKELNDVNMALILKSMNSIASAGESSVGKQTNFGNKVLVKNAETGRYEIVSGKIIGEEPEEEGSSVIIHRHQASEVVQFDENGKKLEAKDSSTESGFGGYTNSKNSGIEEKSSAVSVS